MARKDWVIAFKTSDKNASDIFRNVKTGEHIQRADKQLGGFDNFKTERYPVTVQSLGGAGIELRWFKKRVDANKWMRGYMRRN